MIDGSKLPVLKPLDKRLNAYRDDVADIRLKGKVEAARFVAGIPAHIKASLADLCSREGKDASLDMQLLHGEAISVFEERDGRLWVQAARNGYVGWIDASRIAHDMPAPTHRVIVPRTFLYPGPDMKFPRKGHRSMGSLLSVVGEAETRGTHYALLAGGEAIIASHIAPISHRFDDFVAIAETLLHTPYLWGGDSAYGIDCSGLVSLGLRMCGIDVLRDSDMQAASIGEIVSDFASWNDLQRGDLIFWRGHVGICQGMIGDKAMLIHANGHSMTVRSEPLEEAINRIAYIYEMPIGVRRLAPKTL